jgi:MFS family permease
MTADPDFVKTTPPELQNRPRLDPARALPIFALVLVDVLGLTIILPLLHLYAAAYGATPLEIGLTAAAFPIAQLIGVPVMGALSDRYGRKPLLLISQVTTCISFIWLGLADSLVMIIASRAFDGLFGANLATAQAALSDITTDETRAQGLGLTGAAFGLGFLVGPVIALIALETTDNLAIPAFIAAAYSFASILLTLFLFRETLPAEKRRRARGNPRPAPFQRAVLKLILPLLLLVFAQQIVFYGFESLLGLFTLTRLGFLGQGNAVIFLYVGVILVVVQARYIGRWTRRYGERRLALFALGTIAAGLLMLSATPNQPHPLYVRQIVENDLRRQSANATEAVIGEINIDLPENEGRGIGGVLWVLAALLPLSIGAGLIRPSLNSLITKRSGGAFGSALGWSAASVSLADAIAPLLGGLIFQQVGATAPFLIGGLLMAALCAAGSFLIPPIVAGTQNS